jgi:rhamnosyl/mannosyltransferase
MHGGSQKKHILIIGKYYPPEHGGVERYTSDVVAVAARKYRVTVIVHNTTPHDQIEKNGDITIIRCGTRRIVKSQPISPSMWGHIRRQKPDLIHFNAPNFWAAAALCLIGHRCPIIITHHADVYGRPTLKKLLLPFYRYLVRRSAHVIANSIKNIKSSIDLPPEIPSAIAIPWGVDHHVYQRTPRNVPTERTRRFGDALVVGFVGRLVRYKGLSVLIKALESVDNVHALVIGDGPLRSQIEKQVRQAGLNDRVHLIGNVDEPRKIAEMQMMDALVLPSVETSEAFGLVQVEAQLLGIPTIASDLPTGVTDITVDGVTGLLFPPGDHLALAEILRKLASDRDMARRLGETACQRSLTNFTLEAFQNRVAALFDSTLQSPRTAS